MKCHNRFDVLSSLENNTFLEEVRISSDYESESTTDPQNISDKHNINKPNTSSLSLCDVCKQIFSSQNLSIGIEDDGSQYHHHPSHDSLMEAFRKRCYICSLLVENLTATSEDIPWRQKPGSPRHQGLSYCVNQCIDGAIHVNFGYKNAEGSRIIMLDVTVSTSWVRGRLATEHLGQSTWSKESKEATSRWLKNSISEDEIDPSTIKLLPTRLIHITLAEGGKHMVKLCQGINLSQDTQYFTLSHRWGDNMFRLLTHNLQDLMHQIPYEVLPITFQHAITVTSDLGYNFLWIDSLCIIQDSTEDWLKEGMSMTMIYKNATCNISATAPDDSHQGLFRLRNSETLLPLEVNIGWPQWGSMWGYTDKRPEGYILVNETWHEGIDDMPLSMRGWVFQERLVSQRTIHFGTRQLYWNARSTGGNEQWPKGIPFEADGVVMNDILWDEWESIIDPFHPSDDIFTHWSNLVEYYSEKELTYPTDKLAAISGLAREIQKIRGGEYLAGLWEKNLLPQLLWSVNDPEHSGSIQPYTAPTWSWASIHGGVSHCFRDLTFKAEELPNFQSSYLSSLEGAEALPMLGTDIGPIKAAVLRLRGHLWQAHLVQGNLASKSRSTWTISGKKRKIFFLPDVILPGEFTKSADFVHVRNYLGKLFDYRGGSWTKIHSQLPVHLSSQSVFLLAIYCASCRGKFVTVGLSLIPTDTNRGQFRRVGLFFTMSQDRATSILHLSCDINPFYYEVREGEKYYTVSII
ncbi:heterokaryon incompatibility protein-domain-containing protein [Xylariaceae sp. FL0662B]|nr:heterokaryon incompatibility protein-domain-containing protein [Xylariaceae sp. FL0662B]